MRISEWSSDVCSSDLAKRAQCLSIIVGKRFPILARPRFPHPFLKPRTDGIDRIGKVLPARRWRGRVRSKSARFPFPSGLRPLRPLTFIGSHSGAAILTLVEFKHMEIGSASCKDRVCHDV